MKSTMISHVNVEAGQAASLPAHNAPNPSIRRAHRSLFITAILSLLLIPAAQLQSKAQAIVPAYVPLNAEQLDQLVAPIALDPDPLVAQILIGATFPDQVSDANNWLSTKMNLSPDQRAAGASNMSWDPSVKGLTVFPIVLDSMAKNTAWTTQLGNAYYNQPDDVMDAIQAMRLLALKANYLVATPQQNVEVSEELVEILPVDPNVVFVQYYNPWQIWGTLFDPYPGYVVEAAPAGLIVADGVSLEAGVSVGVDFHFGFSFGGWGPGWDGGAVVYNHNVYNSNSRTVANHDHFGGHDCRAFDHGGHGVPVGFHHGAPTGPARRLPASRPTPQRVSASRLTPLSHSTSAKRSTPTTRSNAVNRTSAHNTSPAHSTSNARTAPARSASSNAAKSAPAGRTMGPNRSTGQPASAAHSPASNRSISQNRSTSSSPSMNRPASAGRTTPAGQSMARSNGASTSPAANRPMARPVSANTTSGARQAMSHTPSAPHTGGGFGGGHVGGGGKR